MNNKIRRRKIKVFYKLANDLYKKDEDAFKDVNLDPSNIYDPRTKRKYVKTPIPGTEDWQLLEEEDKKIRDDYGYEEFTIGEEKYRLYKLLDSEANMMFEVSTGDHWRYEIPEINYRTFGEECFDESGKNVSERCYRRADNKTEKCVNDKFEKEKAVSLEERRKATEIFERKTEQKKSGLKEEAERDFNKGLPRAKTWDSEYEVGFPLVPNSETFDGSSIPVDDVEDYLYYLILFSEEAGVLKKLNDEYEEKYQASDNFFKFVAPYGKGYINSPIREAFLKKLKDECEEELGVKDEPKTRGGLAGSANYISPGFMYNLGNGFYYIKKEDLSENFYGDADYVIFYNVSMFSKKLNNIKKDFIVWSHHNPKVVYSKDKIPDKNPNLLNFWNKIRGFEDYDPEDAAKIEYNPSRPKFQPLCSMDKFKDTPVCDFCKEEPDHPLCNEVDKNSSSIWISWCEKFPEHCPKEDVGSIRDEAPYDHGELDGPKRRKRKSRWVEFCKLNPDHPNCIKYKKTNYNNIYTEDDDLPIRDTKRTNPFKAPYDPKKI